MTFDGALLETHLAPLRQAIEQMAKELAQLRDQLPPKLVTVEEAAKALGVSPCTIRRRVKDGSIPYQRFGRSIRIDLAGCKPLSDEEIRRKIS